MRSFILGKGVIVGLWVIRVKILGHRLEIERDFRLRNVRNFRKRGSQILESGLLLSRTFYGLTSSRETMKGYRSCRYASFKKHMNFRDRRRSFAAVAHDAVPVSVPNKERGMAIRFSELTKRFR